MTADRHSTLVSPTLSQRSNSSMTRVESRMNLLQTKKTYTHKILIKDFNDKINEYRRQQEMASQKLNKVNFLFYFKKKFFFHNSLIIY